MIKKGGALYPAYKEDLARLAKLQNDESFEVQIKNPRNIKFHRKFFALLNLCFENQESFEEIETLRAYCIMKAGYYKPVETPKGVMFLPKSISFAKMDESEFDDLYTKVLGVVSDLLQTAPEEIQLQLNEYF